MSNDMLAARCRIGCAYINSIIYLSQFNDKYFFCFLYLTRRCNGLRFLVTTVASEAG